MTAAPVRCVLCPATEPSALAALAHGWRPCTLAEPVSFRSAFGDLLDTPPGEYAACLACSTFLADPNRAERPLPEAVAASLAALVVVAELAPMTARRLRAELVGAARHLAEQIQPA